MKIRRVVTENNAVGRSQVLSDTVFGDGLQNIELWHELAAHGSATPDPREVPFYPAQDSSIFRVVVLPPDAIVSTEELERVSESFFRMLKIEDCRVDVSRHPLMHRTPTIDYVVVLKGRVNLILDEGDPISLSSPDTVVQRATNHSWSNPGPDELALLVVMLPLRKQQIAEHRTRR